MIFIKVFSYLFALFLACFMGWMISEFVQTVERDIEEYKRRFK